MARDVFISYSSKDAEQGAAVCAALERAGISCWMAPRDIVPGVGWAKSIIQAINTARVVVLLVSAQSNESPQVEREVERAVNKGIPVIPLRIENVPLGDALEYFLSASHWLDAYNPPLEPHLERLTEAVRTLLASGTARREAEKPRMPPQQPPQAEIADPVPPREPSVAKRPPQRAADLVPKTKTEPPRPAVAKRAPRAILRGIDGKRHKAMVAGALASVAAVIAALGAGALVFVQSIRF
jgi:hypothetical protein